MSAQETPSDPAPAPPPARPGFKTADFAGALVTNACVCTLPPLGLEWLLRPLHPLVSPVILGAWTALMTLALLGVRVTPEKELRIKWGTGAFDEELGHALGAMAALPVLFGTLGRALQTTPGGLFECAPPASVGLPAWIVYGWAMAAESILLGIPRLLGAPLTPVRPATTAASALVIAYGLTLDWLVISTILRLVRFVREQKTAPSEPAP
jgi:hypothetical protein